MITVAMFSRNNLPIAARNKNRSKMTLDDLSPAQRSQANERDICAIVDGQYTTIITPIADLGRTLPAVMSEKESQGL